MKKYLSRKLWMTIASIVAALLTDYSLNGTIHGETLMAACAVVVAYLASQGYVDSKEKSSDK